MPHPALAKDAVAVVTGGASGIGFAAAKHFAKRGMKVCIVDLGGEALARAAELLEQGTGAEIISVAADVSDRAALVALEAAVRARFGGVDVLMNNAGIQPTTTALDPLETWERILGVNLMGILHGCQVFAPAMIARGRPGLIINTGSKQGITTPPGNPAYNVSKAGVKAFTEALQHELRNTEGCAVTAHLLIPGFVFTGLTAGERTEKPAAAWTPDETVDCMIASLEKGDFYLLCPDNDVPRALDEKRMAWAIGDVIENARRCRAGIRIMRMRSKRLWRTHRSYPSPALARGGWPAEGWPGGGCPSRMRGVERREAQHVRCCGRRKPQPRAGERASPSGAPLATTFRFGAVLSCP